MLWLYINMARAWFARDEKGEAVAIDCSLNDSTALLGFTGEMETYMTDLQCKSCTNSSGM